MATTDVNKKLDALYKQMNETALEELKRLVYIKFKQNKNLNCYILAMGTSCWTDLNNEVLYDWKVKDIKVGNFIREWDSILKLTGEGVKWYRDGTVITDW